MGALGTVGAKIAGLGGALSGRARSGLTNSRVNQAAQSMGERRRSRLRSGVKLNKDGTIKRDADGKVQLTASGRLKRGIANSKIPIASNVMSEMQGRDRRAYLKQYQDEGMSRRYNNDESLGAAYAGITKAFDEQQLNDYITNMATETNNYDAETMNRLLSKELANYSNAEVGSNDENEAKIRAKALMSKMSEGSYSAKLLAGQMGEGGDNYSVKSRKLLANTLSKSSSINAAISKKDGAAAQYMRELNAGNINARDGRNFSSWYGSERFEEKMDDDGRVIETRALGMSNAQNVAENITDDNLGFASQSDYAIERAMGTKGAGVSVGAVISQDRARTMTTNRQINETATEGAINAIYGRAGRPIPTGQNNRAEQ